MMTAEPQVRPRHFQKLEGDLLVSADREVVDRTHYNLHRHQEMEQEETG